jgi:hypothetical protein
MLALLVALAFAGVALAQGARHAWRRVRDPRAAASLAKYGRLPHWYVMSAALAGAMASETAAILHRWADAEARTSGSCFAAAVLVALATAATIARGAWFAALPAVAAAGALAALHAYQFSYATEKPITWARYSGLCWPVSSTLFDVHASAFSYAQS